LDHADQSVSDESSPPPCLFRFGAAEFDQRRLELRLGGQVVDLPPTPMRLLQELLQAAGSQLDTEDLLQRVWQRRPDHISRQVVSNAIAKIRRALNDEDHLLIVHQGNGYSLNGPVERIALPPQQLDTRALLAGAAIPERPDWILVQALPARGPLQHWQARHRRDGRQRVYQFTDAAADHDPFRLRVLINDRLSAIAGSHDVFALLEDVALGSPVGFVAEAFPEARLSDWLEANGGLATLPLERRLMLLADIADIVAMAHAAGIAHEGLEPSCISVTDVQGHLQLRIGQFGANPLATQTPDRHQQPHPPVAPSARDPLSSMYLAPEQLAGTPATLASDVYALGVLLYQFAIGSLTHPLGVGWESRMTDALLREDIADCVHGDPEQRSLTARELARRLRRRPARERLIRWRAAHAERERQLSQRQQQLQRRRVGVLTLIVALTVGALICIHFAVESEQQAQAADIQHRRAHALTGFLDDALLRHADPTSGGNPDITLDEALQQTLDTLDTALAETPDVRAAMHSALAYNYLRAERFDQAVAHYRQAEAQWRSLQGPTGNDALLAQFQLAQALVQQGERDAPRRLLDAGQKLLAETPGANALTRLKYHEARGFLAVYTDDGPQAVAELHQVVELGPQVPYPDDKMVVIQRNYAQALAMVGHNKESIALLERILSQQRHQLAPDHPALLFTLQQLAQVLDSSELYGRAHPLYLEAYARYRDSMGDTAPLTVSAETDLADNLQALGRWHQALPLYDRARRYYLEQEGPLSLRALYGLAAELYTLNRLGRWRQAADLAANHLPPPTLTAASPHPRYQAALLEWAEAADALGRTATVDQLLTILQPRTLDALPGSRPDAWALIHRLRGAQALREGRRDQAADQLQAAWADYARSPLSHARDLRRINQLWQAAALRPALPDGTVTMDDP